MEHIKEINGIIVYVGGTWFEISLSNGGGVMYSGSCAPNTDPQTVYDYHFPLSPKDGWLMRDVTLFYCSGAQIFLIHAGRALMNMENARSAQDGYNLWFTIPRSGVFSTVTFRTANMARPRIIAVEGFMTLPEQFGATMLKNEKVQRLKFYAESPLSPQILEAVTNYLDHCKICWWEM